MRYVLLVLFVVTLSGCVTKEAPVVQVDLCPTQSYDVWRVDVNTKNKGNVIERYMDAETRDVFVAAYNATPPRTDVNPANVAFWVSIVHLQHFAEKKHLNWDTHPVGLIVWIDENDCIVTTEVIPLFIIDKLLQGVPVVPQKGKPV